MLPLFGVRVPLNFLPNALLFRKNIENGASALIEIAAAKAKFLQKKQIVLKI